MLAADRGLDFFLETGLVPDIVDGDFDSLSGAGKAYLESLDHTEIVRLNPEKDDTDTQSTLNLAIRRGAKNILILGATGGRLDHFIGNMGLFGIWQTKKGVNVILADVQNYICLVENGHIIRKDSQFGKYAHSIPFHSLNPSPLEDAAQPPERKRKERQTHYRVYEEIIKDNIEYDYLIQDRYLDRDRIRKSLPLFLKLSAPNEEQSVSPGTTTRQSL